MQSRPKLCPKLEEILTQLKDSDEKVRDKARSWLRRLGQAGLTIDEGVHVLNAATEPFPPRDAYWQDTSENLVSAASAHPQPEYIPLVKELFPQFSEGAKTAALQMLAELPQSEAAVVFMDVIRLHPKAREELGKILAPLHYNPRHAQVFLSKLFDYASDSSSFFEVCHLSLACSAQGIPVDAVLLPRAERLAQEFSELRDKLMPLQRAEGIAWISEDRYQEARYPAAILLDLFGHVRSSEVVDELRRSLEFHDPRLKCFAILSLLRLGHEADRQRVVEVAANPETRGILYDQLEKLKRISLYPKQYLTQEALAEADMVNWLIYPTELGRAPDEIELMEIISGDTNTDDGILDWYLFRFRTHPPHWAAEDGWVAGVSGPFRRKGAPKPWGLGDTLSSFTAWDSKSAEGHVEDVRELMDKWRQHSSEEVDS